MNNKTIGIVIGVAVAILIGVILVTIIAEQTNSKTTLITVTDTVDISPVRLTGGAINYTAALRLYAKDILSKPAGTNWRTDYPECAITYVNFYNQTGSLMSNSADYTWVEDGNGAGGWLRPKNVDNLNSSGSNTTTITYNTCPDEFVAQSWGRTILNLIPGFFVLAILLGSAFVIYWILKNEGIVITQ